MKTNLFLRLSALVICFALILSFVLLAASCGNTPPDNGQEPSGNGGDNGNDGSSDADAVINIFKDGKSDFSIVFSNEGVEHETYANFLCELIEWEFEYSGFEPYEHTENTCDKEILIGATSRQISAELVSAVESADKSGNDFVWGYGYKDGKLAFYANSDNAFYLGWNEFCDNIIHEDGVYCDSDLWVIGRKSYSRYLFEQKLLFEDKVISFLGDSITTYEGYSTAGNEIYYRPTGFLNNVNDTYWMQIVNNYKMTLGANDGWSGSRISWDGTEMNNNKVGDGMYMASQERIDTLDDNGTPDFIVVYGGTNDIRYEALGSLDDIDWDTVLDYENMTRAEREALPVNDFAHSTVSMLAGLKMTYPDAHILVLIPTWAAINNIMTTDEMVKERVNAFAELYIEVCEKFSIDYIDLRTICTYEEKASSGYFGDPPAYLHPSKAGMTKIFETVKVYYDALMEQYVED